jgi:hypothetical protein
VKTSVFRLISQREIQTYCVSNKCVGQYSAGTGYNIQISISEVKGGFKNILILRIFN